MNIEDTDIVYTTRPCPYCGVPSQILMSQAQHQRMLGGEYIQDIFPDWPASKRELLITGSHSSCWDKMFPT
jgi:hypothetical protein